MFPCFLSIVFHLYLLFIHFLVIDDIYHYPLLPLLDTKCYALTVGSSWIRVIKLFLLRTNKTYYGNTNKKTDHALDRFWNAFIHFPNLTLTTDCFSFNSKIGIIGHRMIWKFPLNHRTSTCWLQCGEKCQNCQFSKGVLDIEVLSERNIPKLCPDNTLTLLNNPSLLWIICFTNEFLLNRIFFDVHLLIRCEEYSKP